MRLNIQKIIGGWKTGWVLDLHTISSTLNPDGTFNNEQSDIGKCLSLLKYQDDRSQINPIVKATTSFLNVLNAHYGIHFAALLPIPPSNTKRDFQPVFEIAKIISKKCNIPLYEDFILKTKQTKQGKELLKEDWSKEIEGAFDINLCGYKEDVLKNKRVLLFDDLYRTGVTLEEATKILYEKAHVQDVYVLAITKTRTSTGLAQPVSLNGISEQDLPF